jgi:Tfp pilus assembly protein PilN
MADVMASRNQVPNITARGKAARRRSWIASGVLFCVAVASVALTVYVWVSRAALNS